MAKFFRRGISKVHFCPAVAGASPTRPEITAGTPLSASIAEMGGWALSNSPIPTPNLDSRYTPQIPGEDTTPDSTFTMDDDDAASTIRTALAKGTNGFIILMPYGDVPTKRLEKWPVTVTGVNDTYSTDNTPARFIAGFAITGVPVQNGTVPA